MSKEITKSDQLVGTVSKMKDQFQLALPSHIDPDKFIRVAQTLIRTNTALQKCNSPSIYSALLKCAADGLYADGIHAALVPFGENCQYMVMLQGVLKKIRQSGEVISIEPDCVFEKDDFDYYKDDKGTVFLHRPNYKEDRGKFVLAYSKAVLKDGSVMITVMSKSEIDKVRESSRSKNSGPWVQWYEEMAKKTVVRRQSKFLPNSTDLESMFKSEDDYEQRDVAPAAAQLNAPTENATQDVTPAEPKDKTKPNKLSGMIKDQKPVTETEPVIEAEIVETKTEDEDAPV